MWVVSGGIMWVVSGGIMLAFRTDWVDDWVGVMGYGWARAFHGVGAFE
jgi:hypothetical protein